jgi:hypothetical protein
MKQHWPYVPGKSPSNSGTDVRDAVTEVAKEVSVGRQWPFIARTVKVLRRRVRGGDQTVQSRSVRMLVQVSERSDSTTSASLTSDERDWLSRLTQETNLGHFIRDLV